MTGTARIFATAVINHLHPVGRSKVTIDLYRDDDCFRWYDRLIGGGPGQRSGLAGDTVGHAVMAAREEWDHCPDWSISQPREPPNPSAFPDPPPGGFGPECGMSLRDYFAGQALAGLMARTSWSDDEAAAQAYGFADSMLNQRKGTKQ
jgi:hypothetical protein